MRCLCCLLALLLTSTVLAAERSSAKKKRGGSDGDSAPVLMSRTGGGSTFADVKELREAAAQGNPKAQAQYGEMLLTGDATNGVTQDQASAIAMLEKAARAGEASAAFRLGMLLDDGIVVAQDRPRALAYFKAAAAGGSAEALHNIGAAYASARGVKPDVVEALAWLTLAGKRGADPTAEKAVRERLEKSRLTKTIAKGEQRAIEIERELAAKSVAEWLPEPAPFGPASATPAKR